MIQDKTTSESEETRPRKSPILLCDGGVESLLCGLILEQEFSSGIRMRHLRGSSGNATRLEACARQQATLLEVPIEVADGANGQPHAIQTLCDGLNAAGSEDFLIWPVRCGPEAISVARQLELAQHLARAFTVERQIEQVTIDTPMIDLDTVQILDMIFDIGAPLEVAWPCDRGEQVPCGGCQGCSTWREAAKSLDREWPWGEIQSPT